LSQTVTWTIGLRADVRGSVTWVASGELPAVIPIDLPDRVTLTDLTNPDVYTRVRTGSRIDAWLKRPLKSGALSWQGSVPCGTSGVELPVNGAGRIVVRPATGWSISIPPTPGILVEPAEGGGFSVTAGPGVRTVPVRVQPPVFAEK
jgi:hypothetical protein